MKAIDREANLFMDKLLTSWPNFGFEPPMGSNHTWKLKKNYTTVLTNLNEGIGNPCAGQVRLIWDLWIRVAVFEWSSEGSLGLAELIGSMKYFKFLKYKLVSSEYVEW